MHAWLRCTPTMPSRPGTPGDSEQRHSARIFQRREPRRPAESSDGPAACETYGRGSDGTSACETHGRGSDGTSACETHGRGSDGTSACETHGRGSDGTSACETYGRGSGPPRARRTEVVRALPLQHSTR